MNPSVLIEPFWQNVWHWPAVMNLILGGTGCGFFLSCIIAQEVSIGGDGSMQGVVSGLTGPFLVLLGFASVGVEAGRPSAAGYLLHHWRSSWMSREILIGIIFVLAAILDVFFRESLFRTVAGLAAGGVLLSQGYMVNRSRAVTVWNRSLTPLYFFTSGINLGFGLLLIWAAAFDSVLRSGSLVIGVIALILNLVIWYCETSLSNDTYLRRALQLLRRKSSQSIVMGVGHIFPGLLMMGVLLLTADSSGGPVLRILYTVAGLAILCGGIQQRFALILQAGMLREVRAGLCGAR